MAQEARPDEPIRWLVAAGGLASVVSGAVLTFAYRPGELGWLRTLHSGSSAVAVISVVAWAVVRRRGRLRLTALGTGIVAGLAVVVGGAFATGPGLAWEGGDGSSRGVFVGAGHAVTVDGRVISPGDLAVTFAVHVGLTVCTAAVVLWQYRRCR